LLPGAASDCRFSGRPVWPLDPVRGAAHGPQSWSTAPQHPSREHALGLRSVPSKALRPSLLEAMERKKQHRGKLQKVLREQKARLYIIRRCVVMLLCWSD
ncbi:hypothetical protein EJB05_42533, partial [Eragrostis curvula]